jgi:FAD/FMN-containing dehydrogenase
MSAVHTGSQSPRLRRLIELAADCVTAEELAFDEATLARAACDVFFEGAPPLAVLSPRHAATLEALVPRLAAARIGIVARGAALSYSAGTLGDDGRNEGDWVAIDLRRLDRVIEVNPVDRTVRVEAGCTWEALHRHLEPFGLRTPFWGPASGLHATIGGGLASDAMFFGTATVGCASGSVLGLSVLLADGRVLRTGVMAAGAAPLAHPFGPDLTGLFLGSCGALGVILEATLPLMNRPGAVRLAGFRCQGAGTAARTLASLAAAGAASEVLLFDPSLTTLLEGSPASVQLAPGRRAAPGAPYSVSLAIEGRSTAEADLRLQAAVAAALAGGAEPAGDGVLGAWRSTPFQPPSMLRDSSGRRWVPVHGIVAHSQVMAAWRALDRCMQEHAVLIEALGLKWSVTGALVGRGAVLIEANLYWPDAGNPLTDHYLGRPDSVPAENAPRVEHWRQVLPVRVALAEALDELGASHLQIGRFYAYRSRLDAPARDVLEAFKRALDPHGVMNPGALGIGGDATAAGSRADRN